MHQRHVPHHHAAPVMAAKHRVLQPQRVEHAGEIAGQMLHVVVGHCRRPRGSPIAALVRRDGAEAGGRQRRQLVAPGIGELGETVAQHDRHAVLRPGLVDRHVDAVGLDDGRFGKGGHALLRFPFWHSRVSTNPGRAVPPGFLDARLRGHDNDFVSTITLYATRPMAWTTRSVFSSVTMWPASGSDTSSAPAMPFLKACA